MGLWAEDLAVPIRQSEVMARNVSALIRGPCVSHPEGRDARSYIWKVPANIDRGGISNSATPFLMHTLSKG